MRIVNAKVFGTDCRFKDDIILIANGRFVDPGKAADIEEDSVWETIDASGCYAIPGLIDIHFHGAVGDDVCDGTPEAIRRIAAYEASVGVTAICPATMTLPVDELNKVLANMAFCQKTPAEKGADLVGINMEGPFISKVKKGAQDERNIIPCDAETARGFLDASEGLVKFIGIAPEENPNFKEFITALKGKVRISLAHTNSSYETAMEAFEAGADHVVHLYNAMPPLHHRKPGVIAAVSDSPRTDAEIICDGVHIHPAMVRAAFRLMGADRMVLISDSMRATGMPDGQYTLGGLAVKKEGKHATLVSDGALAGSVTNLADCMRNAAGEMGLGLETAVRCATINPARSIGADREYGSIEPGKKADVVLLDRQDLSLKAVIKDGKILVNNL